MRKVFVKKNSIAILFALSLAVLISGIVFTNSYNTGLCLSSPSTNTYDVSCHIIFERVGGPLLYGGGALSLIFLILLFIPQAVVAWKKFAIWFVPLAALVFIFYPEPTSGDFFSPYPEQIFRWTSAAYILISLIIIFVKGRKVREGNQ